MKRKLPVGIQDFVKLRETQHVYVDKTEIIYDLIIGVSFSSEKRNIVGWEIC